MKIKATVGILTFNSGETLKRAIESVKDFDEILICDGGSTDNTLDIAESYGARIISQNTECKNSDGSLADFSCVRNQCLKESIHDWFLYIDSDEIADENLVDEIRYITNGNNDGNLVYSVTPRIVYEGRVIEYSSNYPGWQKRFFNKKSGAIFVKAVHERIEFDQESVKEGKLIGHWHYFVDKEDLFVKLKKYSLMEAKLSLKSKKTIFRQIFQRLVIIFKISVKSLKNYVLHGFKETMPPSAEFNRILYNLITIHYLLWRKKIK